MHARPDRSTFLAVASLSLALLLGQGCDGTRPKAGAGPEPAGAATADVGRFDVRSVALKRGPGLLLRLDTATGQAWTMGVMDAAKWQPTREGADGVPTPDGNVSGRYTIKAIKASRGAPTLVRTDQATGRIWRKPANKGQWVAVPNPDPSITEPAADDEPAGAAPSESDAEAEDSTAEAATL